MHRRRIPQKTTQQPNVARWERLAKFRCSRIQIETFNVRDMVNRAEILHLQILGRLVEKKTMKFI